MNEPNYVLKTKANKANFTSNAKMVIEFFAWSVFWSVFSVAIFMLWQYSFLVCVLLMFLVVPILSFDRKKNCGTNEISNCTYTTISRNIQIYGKGKSACYNYSKDDKFLDSLSKNKCFTGGTIYFSTDSDTDTDYKKEIEEHSTLKLIVANG